MQLLIEGCLATSQSKDKLVTLMKEHKGNARVILEIKGPQGQLTKICCGEGLKISRSTRLVEEVKELFGSNCIAR